MRDELEIARKVAWRTGLAVGSTVSGVMFGGIFLLHVSLTNESRANTYRLIDALNQATGGLQEMTVAYRRCRGLEPCNQEMLELKWKGCEGEEVEP